MKKYICIHGHFYQPPRENPWTGKVSPEESASPFQNWNERISNECYEPNTQAAILDEHGRPAKKINNFLKISFDIGPTLLSWLKLHNLSVYKAIIEADRQSVKDHGGHGNAMAQVYNHIIMPLASKRDKLTQIIWGIRDFEYHYGRKPEGMWLSETAVDKESLDLMVDQGIKFTVLAPRQAYRVRRVGFGMKWHHIHHAIDTKHAYRVILEKGKPFNIFFYDGPISQGAAFEGLLNNGDQFMQRLLNAFSKKNEAQIVSIAMDGETFGHHHRFGEMALAYVVNKIETEKTATISNYGEFLAKNPPIWEVEIRENSSWSCSHGVERWRSNCGCHIHHTAGWTQKWRTPLREAFDFLKDIADEVFEKELAALLKDPWQARNQYIDVLVDPSHASKEKFLSKITKKKLNAEEVKKVWDLLEAQKFALFMYTSCAWFFDDISGLEPQQGMRFAARAMELIQPYHRREIEKAFLRILSDAKSNIPEQGSGREVYERFVKPVKETRHGI